MDSSEELHVVIKTEKQQTSDEQESFEQETMFFNTSNILPAKHETDEDAGEMYICNTENLQFCKNEGEITVDKILPGETNVDKILIGETTLLKTNGNKLLNCKSNNEKVKTNKFFCEQCGSSFSFKSGLSRHVIKAHKKKISKNNKLSSDTALEFCPEKKHNHLIKDLSASDIKTRLNANFGKKHDSIKFPCDKCFETFDTQKLLKKHAKSHILSCEVCRLSFTGKKELDRHRIDSNHNPTYACSVCSSVFDTEKQVMKHMRLHTGDSVNECEFCLKTFNQKHHLVNHLRQHTGEKPFECLLCGKKFRRKAYLQIHQISHTGEKLFKCDICSVSLSSKWSLRCHMKTHKEYANSRDMVDTLQYPCEDCGMAFKRNDALTNHKMKVHTNERPFKCLVCGVGFRKGSHLMNHSRLHTGEKPFMCELCGNKFRRPSYLRDHARLVHGQEQPFKCEKCQKPFMTENTLQKHLITCTPGKPKKTYECHICQKNYVNKICFTNHISKCQKSSGEDFCTCGMKKPPTELKSQNVKNVESVNMVNEGTKRLNDGNSDKKSPSLKSVNNKRLKLSSDTCIDNKDIEDMNDTDNEIGKSFRISDNNGTEIYSETNSCQDENSNGPSAENNTMLQTNSCLDENSNGPSADNNTTCMPQSNSCQDENSNGPSAENNTMPQTNWCQDENSNGVLVENNFANEELTDNFQSAHNFSCERCGKPFMVTLKQMFMWEALKVKYLCGKHLRSNIYVGSTKGQIFMWEALKVKYLCGKHLRSNIYVGSTKGQIFMWEALKVKYLCGKHLRSSIYVGST